MAGMDDNLTMIGDWTPNPSPRTYIPSFLNEEFGSRAFSDILGDNGSEKPLLESEKRRTFMSSKEEGDEEVQLSSNFMFELNSFDAHKSSSRGGLAERMAARAGFNAPKLNTARIRSANMSSSSTDIRSPYLTIPPGLSPTTLLDSPVFLSNSMAQPSPTTGKVSFGQDNSSNLFLTATNGNKEHMLEDLSPEAFAFKPHLNSSSSFFSRAENKPLASIEVSAQSEHPLNFRKQDYNQAGFSDLSERELVADDDDAIFNQRGSDSFMGNNYSSPPDNQPDGEADLKEEFSSVAAGNDPAEDTYNWRKYGQKQVKGSEYPRSYYKCTHPNCQVKKKVERNHEGQITEIIYKGNHNHSKPPPSRRAAIGPSHFSEAQLDGSDNPAGSQAGFDGKHNDWRNDGIEATSSAGVAAEFCDLTTNSMQTQSPDAIDASSTLSNDEDEDDRATHGSASLGCDGDGDETESKRRKLENCTMEMSAASRAVREPRVVVQTTSEVDILDDGYRWRKYGQKVVKGNPNPRSYYKCTNPGCTVRKHVERASHDLKSVITTYEGKHNHDVPAARNSGSHISTLTSSANGASSVAQPHGIHRRPEPPIQDGLMRFGAFGRDPMGPAAAFGFGIHRQGMTNFGMGGMNSNVSTKMPPHLPPGRSFMGHQQATAGFMVPKGEPKEESVMPEMSSSVYHQMMGRLPLGPQL